MRTTPAIRVSRLPDFIRSLSPAAEFWIVVVAAFALPILNSQLILFDPPAGLAFEPAQLRALVVEEALVLLWLGWFLTTRGWDLAGLSAYPSWRDCAQGLLLGCGFLFAWAVLWAGLQPLLGLPPPAADTQAFAPGLDWPTLLALCIINPLYEELLVCAYVISALAQRLGLGLAIAMSIAIRVAYHTYQGLEGILAMALMGVLFCLWFVRTRRLWPLVIAHGIGDLAGLVSSTWS